MNSQASTALVELPAELRSLLQSLRQQLRRYSVLSGILGLVIAATVAFWATTGLDSGWFALQRLELPVGLRVVLLTVMLAGGCWLLWSGIILSLLRRIHDRDLALLLERRFPDYQDRLITAVEGAAGLPVNGPLSSAMLQRTVSDADRLSRERDSADVLNSTPLKQRGWVAGILLLSVAGLGAAAPDSLPRWWNAFVLCEPVYHQRTTLLEVRVIQQPGDRRLPFRRTDEAPYYLHPRGNDLEIEMTVPESSSPAGQLWTVPERVRVDVRRQDGTTSRTYVSATSDRVFRYVVTRLQDDIEIELLGGDFRTPQPLTVRSVDPPALDDIRLRCDYPEYTRWNQLRSTDLQITGSETSLPVGTRFQLTARSAKPLQSVRIVTDDFELTGDSASSHLEYRGAAAETTESGLLSADGFLITADLILVPDSSSAGPSDTATAEAADEEDRDGVPAVTPPEGSLAITAGTSLKFFLHDQDDVMSTRPLLFRVQGIPDRPPTIDIRADGIDSAITRRAVIPFSGSIRDDYGLQSAEFEFIVDDETQWRPRPFSTPLAANTTEYVPGSKGNSPDSARKPELFQVQPLDLTEGQTLSIAVTATDGCTIGGVNTSRSDPGIYRIVSDDELLSLLYAREINLRRRFEDTLRELQAVRDDLIFHEQVARRIEEAGSSAQPEDRSGLTTCATQSGNTLRRQVNELNSILQGFEGIIQQLVNNAIPLAQSDAMKKNIVAPLKKTVTDDLPAADRAVSRFRIAAMSGEAAAQLVKDSEQQVDQVITRLVEILDHVRNMAEFHEALSDLRALQEEQKRIMEETKRLKRQRLIDEL